MSEIRFLDVLPEAGELVLSRDAGGWRHFLDGKPVSCGTVLAGKPGTALRGKRVRYESLLDGPDAIVVLHFVDGSERVAKREDRFVWPKPRAPSLGAGVNDGRAVA